MPSRPITLTPCLETTSGRSVGASGEQARARPHLLLEVALLGALFLAYRLGRMLISGHVDAALANAWDVWHLERALRLPNEELVQDWVLGWPGLVSAANWYYVTVHFPITAAFLAWGWWRRPPSEYRWARRLIITLTSFAFVVHTVLPLAPPRMMHRLGFVDTMAVVGPSAYGDSTTTVANQFAAMPSLHVGWALLLAFVIIRTTSTRWRWVTLAHPAATMAVVVATANHYWLDGLVAAVLLWLAVLVTPGPAGPRTVVASAPDEAARERARPSAEPRVPSRATGRAGVPSPRAGTAPPARDQPRDQPRDQAREPVARD